MNGKHIDHQDFPICPQQPCPILTVATYTNIKEENISVTIFVFEKGIKTVMIKTPFEISCPLRVNIAF